MKISCISRICRVWTHDTTQQTDDLYIIICNCIYIVINWGWNNVAVKIVACWNWNVFTSSSWLDGHGEFVFTTHVRRDPPHSNSPVRSSSFEWECNVTAQPIWFRLLKWTFSTCFCGVVVQRWHGAMLSGGLAEGRWAVLGMVTESFWHHIFTEVTRAREKSQLLYAGCVILLWTDCFETYMVVTHPLDLCYHEKMTILDI